MSATQQNREIEITTPLGKDVLLLRGMTMTEELGRLFKIDLELNSGKNIKFEDLLGQNVSIRLNLASGKRFFNGYVSSISQSLDRGRYAVYHATVHPRIWFLTRRSNCRIFQKKTVPDIVKDIFKKIDYTHVEDKLSGSYRTLEYCVQYRETDFNFVSRLLEQEGIYYYFVHEADKHTLILADSYTSHNLIPGCNEIPFNPTNDMAMQEEGISNWYLSKQIQSGVYALNEYHFIKPKADLEVNSSISQGHSESEHEIYDYPGDYIVADEGNNYARTRIEELHAQYEQVNGQSVVRGLMCGGLFTLSNFPRADQNREYLVVSVNHSIHTESFEAGEGAGRTVYTNSFNVIESKTQFRPTRITPKPIVQGPQTAVVVGPKGDEIYTDKYGRIKVQFHWDRDGKMDENSSCWMRVSQNWAGKRWGAMFLPRKGQEVIVDFLEGDPDQPIITGRVYNDDHKTPYALPEHMTKSTIKTYSSKGGGGFNELRFEDKKGSEQVFVHAEKDLHLRAKNDRLEWIGRDRHLHIKRDKVEKVERDQQASIKRDLIVEAGRDHHFNVKGKQAVKITGSQSLSVTGDVAEEFKGNHSEQVTGTLYLKGMQVVVEAATGLTIKVGGNFITLNPGGIFIQGILVNINSGGSALSGSAGSLVSPIAPIDPLEADNAVPGEADTVPPKQSSAASGKSSSSSGSSGSVSVGQMNLRDMAVANAPSHDPTAEKNRNKKSWVEVKLVDEEEKPVPGEKYRITLPDGQTLAEGTLDEKGFARVENIDPGNCKITFPELDREAWKPK